MRSVGPGWAHPKFFGQAAAARLSLQLAISDLRLFSKRRTRRRLWLSTSRSDRSAAFPGSSATAAQACQVDAAISRTQLRPALADGLRRLRSQNLPARRTRHRQIPADPDQPPLRPFWAELADHRRIRWGFKPSPRLTIDVSGPSSAT